MTWDEGRVIERAVAEMRRQQVPVTPQHVEMAVNACRARPGGTTDPRPGAVVPASKIAAAWLTPKHPDGSGGELLGTLVAEQAASPVRFLEPRPYHLDRDERARLQEEQQGLRAYVDRHGVPAHEQERARRRLAEIQRRLDEIRAGRQPESTVDRAGARTGIPGGGR